MTQLQEMLETLIRDASVYHTDTVRVRDALAKIGYSNNFESIFGFHGLLDLTCDDARRVAREKAERIYGTHSS